ncbi:MAG: PEP-CTERM sorting domain-containing protein [Armatimonadetes bacterium]|nr:PEP-CTERM sorting domain-containing protein [Armatimonadota bacterium]
MPEPASLVLLFAGGVPLVLRRRRRRASISVRRPVCATPERSKADARQRWLHDTGPGGRRPGIVGP